MARRSRVVTVVELNVLDGGHYRPVTRYILAAGDERFLWHSSYGGKHIDGRPFEVGDELILSFTVRGTRPDGLIEITRAKAAAQLTF